MYIKRLNPVGAKQFSKRQFKSTSTYLALRFLLYKLITYTNHWAVTPKLIKRSTKIIFQNLRLQISSFERRHFTHSFWDHKGERLHWPAICQYFVMLHMHPFPIPPRHKLCHPSVYPREILEQVHTGTFIWIITNAFLLLLCFCLGIVES